jgi:hypothetical protein
MIDQSLFKVGDKVRYNEEGLNLRLPKGEGTILEIVPVKRQFRSVGHRQWVRTSIYPSFAVSGKLVEKVEK